MELYATYKTWMCKWKSILNILETVSINYNDDDDDDDDDEGKYF
jgi:hypothetical protein